LPEAALAGGGWAAFIVTDPWFYAAAIPAVLLTGLAKSGFASGFGALAVPLMALVVPVPQAAAIMLPLLLVMDATGLQQLWKHRDRALVRRIVPWGLLGIGLGWLGFGLFSAQTVSGLVGALTLLFLAQRLLFPPRATPAHQRPWLAPLAATVGGFTSFIAHAGGPPLSAWALPLRLPPLVLSGTLGVYFAVINLAKWGPYAGLGLIDLRNMATALLLMPLAPLGVWLGVRLTGRVSQANFYRLAYTGMGLAGAKLLWDGLG
jgi:uncharacterized membrane protein YfcA